MSRAAPALALGEPDILDLALSVGYNSHEAFSRAFKEHFLKTPEQVRAQRHTDNLDLMEPILMQHNKAATLAEPRNEVLRDKLSVVGFSRFYPFDKVGQIPDQWQSFSQTLARINKDDNVTTYGVIYNGSDVSFDYLCGVALSKGAACPENLVSLDLAPQNYLVFSHPGHVANLRNTCDSIWSDWLPESNRSAIEAPWFEKYGESFNPMTGEGGLEIWIPVSPQSDGD